jgi:hypothetical protein
VRVHGSSNNQETNPSSPLYQLETTSYNPQPEFLRGGTDIVTSLCSSDMVAPPRILSSLGSQAPRPIPPLPPNAASLVLHMDINETILVGDDAGGDSREESLNKILAKSAFVQLPPNAAITSFDDTAFVKPTHWWDGTSIGGDAVPPLYTGWEWPLYCVPYYRTAYKKLSKGFVNGHGCAYRSLYEDMERILSFPHPDMPNVLSHILPALFRTLEELTRRKEPFRIVFRSFGSDLVEVTEAVSFFARGQHPDYPHFRNDDLVLTQANLVKGRWSENGLFQLWSQDGSLEASGDDEILDWIQRRTICGIQDDYEFWSRHGCEPWSGKPVWVPTRRRRQHHILFDDNIHNLAHDSIASVRLQSRDGASFRTLSGEEIQQMQGVHLVRVPTIEPILNPDWFLIQIDKARARYAIDAEDDDP